MIKKRITIYLVRMKKTVSEFSTMKLPFTLFCFLFLWAVHDIPIAFLTLLFCFLMINHLQSVRCNAGYLSERIVSVKPVKYKLETINEKRTINA